MSVSSTIRRALAAVLCCVPVAAALAQSSSTVAVTATRTPWGVDQAVAEVSVLERRDIERAEGRTLAELLSQQAGFQFSANGGLGKTASLFIRGLEARHTLLLIDGVRVASATVGTPSIDNLPLEGIERIEIVRGPMSSLYGGGAMGGVIQVFTRRGAPGLAGSAKLSLGSHDHRQVAAGVQWGQGAFDTAVHLQHTDTQGVSSSNPSVPFGSYNPDDDGFRQNAGSVRLGWQASTDWRLEALALQSESLTQLDDGPGADARAQLLNRVLSLSARGAVMLGWRTRLSLSRALDSYDTLASASPFASLGAIESRQRQISWENTFSTPAGAVLLLAERLTEEVGRPGAPFSVSDRDIDGVALGLNGSAAGHSWQASVRRDSNSQFGGFTSSALGYAYALTPSWRLGGSLGTSFVAPSFNQLYFPNFGNPLLLPETGRHQELSLRWKTGGHSLRAAWYGHRYRGFITSGPQPVNLPRADIDGVTLSYEGRFRALSVAASLDHTDPRNDTVGNANFGKLLPRRAQDALRLAADWDGGAWTTGAALAAFSHRYDNPANTSRLGGYATLDLRTEWAFARDLRLGFKLNNVADKRYETAQGYDAPRREAFVTLRWAGARP